jgi:hypothetical protein
MSGVFHLPAAEEGASGGVVDVGDGVPAAGGVQRGQLPTGISS